LVETVGYPDGVPPGLLFDFGYALTVHKSQGSAFDEVLLYPERFEDDSDEEYARWLYTAVTRAAKKLTIVRY
jgi:exodeoxyribonuclease-5